MNLKFAALIVVACVSCKPTSGEPKGLEVRVDANYYDFPSADLSECYVPEFPQMEYGVGEPRVLKRTGSDCARSAMPRMCLGDIAPPRILVGYLPDLHATAVSGVTVEKVKLDGREVLKIEMVDTQDFDFEEECPLARSFLTVLVRVGEDPYLLGCEMLVDWTELPLVGGGGNRSFRETHLDDRRVCFFDPEVYEIDPQVFARALSSEGVGVAVMGAVIDGAGNTAEIFLGEGTLDSTTCGFRTRRDAADAPARIDSTISCGGGCFSDLQIASTTTDLSLDPVFSADPGDYTVFLPRPTVTVRHQGRVLANAGPFCDDLNVQVWVSRLSGGGVEFVRTNKPYLCDVELDGDQYDATCVLDADSMEFEASQGVELSAEIVVLAKVRDEHISHEEDVSEVFP